MIKFCSLFSGSSGNCIFVGTEETKILIDAGYSGKRIAEALESIGENPKDLSAIFVTHEHSDHIFGVGVMSRRYNLPIYANEKTWEAMAPWIGKIHPDNKMLVCGDVCFDDMRVASFSTSHDAADPAAYSFYHDGKKITVATDTGVVTDEVRMNALGSDLILLESNHDVEMLKTGPYPYPLKKRILGEHGHLSNDAASDLLVELVENNTEKVFLGHLSAENNTPDIALETAAARLIEDGINPQKDVYLRVAPRYEAGEVVVLK